LICQAGEYLLNGLIADRARMQFALHNNGPAGLPGSRRGVCGNS
jgi:hypothetical protein